MTTCDVSEPRVWLTITDDKDNGIADVVVRVGEDDGNCLALSLFGGGAEPLLQGFVGGNCITDPHVAHEAGWEVYTTWKYGDVRIMYGLLKEMWRRADKNPDNYFIDNPSA